MSEKFRKNNVTQSIFEKNYQQLPEIKKEILDQKYNCSICLELIKYENPFLCYECQKIFHHSCLKGWDTKQKQLNKKLSCPNCRNELAFENWKVLRNYDETRTKDAEILNQIGKSFNSDEYIDKSKSLFKLVLNKLGIIHPMIESQKNHKLNTLIEEFQLNLVIPSIEEISKIILEELDIVEEYIINVKKGIKKDDLLHKNEINIKYKTNSDGNQKIFGEKFVENNKNNISLIINGKNSPLIKESYLKKGENNITINIKNKLTNLLYMFTGCKTLFNIDELKYLDTGDVTDFSYAFENCPISNLKALENWDTSKSDTFCSMFSCNESITHIKALKNWNVSRCKDFSYMFYDCSQLTYIKSLSDWNVSNGENFSYLFANLYNLYDIKAVENWNVSKGTNFGDMFSGCCELVDIKPLEKWNVSNGKNFKGFFLGQIYQILNL